MTQSGPKVGSIKDVSGEVNIAGGDNYKDYTPEQVSTLLAQITPTHLPKFEVNFQPLQYFVSNLGRCPLESV